VHATTLPYIAGTRESTVGHMDMWLIRSPMNFGVAVHTVHGFTGELWGADGEFTGELWGVSTLGLKARQFSRGTPGVSNTERGCLYSVTSRLNPDTKRLGPRTSHLVLACSQKLTDILHATSDEQTFFCVSCTRATTCLDISSWRARRFTVGAFRCWLVPGEPNDRPSVGAGS
jgi:hypothetical protein